MRDVLEVYTMPQVFAFVNAAHIGMEEEFVGRATAGRLAMAQDKDWKKFHQDRRYREAKRKGKVISPAQAQRLNMLLGGGKQSGGST